MATTHDPFYRYWKMAQYMEAYRFQWRQVWVCMTRVQKEKEGL